MDDQLQKLKDTRKQRDDLKAELDNLQAALRNNRKHQEISILRGLRSWQYETEIVRLQTRIEGNKTAIKSLEAELKEMDEENAIRLRQKKIEQVQKSKAECAEMLLEIYFSFAEDINRIVELRAKYIEYKLEAREIIQQDYFLLKVGNLLETFRIDLPKTLAGFPKEIFADGKLPKPEELTRILKKR